MDVVRWWCPRACVTAMKVFECVCALLCDLCCALVQKRHGVGRQDRFTFWLAVKTGALWKYKWHAHEKHGEKQVSWLWLCSYARFLWTKIIKNVLYWFGPHTSLRKNQSINALTCSYRNVLVQHHQHKCVCECDRDYMSVYVLSALFWSNFVFDLVHGIRDTVSKVLLFCHSHSIIHSICPVCAEFAINRCDIR